ncbi:rod shape-determining protein RodA [Caldicellulosiruptoraceae bacterium PP1]
MKGTNSENVKKIKIDIVMFILMIILIFIGFLLIASASNLLETGQYKLLFTQFMWFCIGLIVFFVFYLVDYKIIINFYIIFYIFVIGMLLYVDFKGVNILGGQRWIKLGPFSFQPSEISKLLMVIFIAKYVSNTNDINKITNLLKVLLLSGIPILLVFKQPDLGTASVFIASLIIIIFVAGLDLKYIFYSLIFAIIMIPISWKYILFPHQKDRILILLNPYKDPLGKGYQVLQSITAIGSGKLFGKGLFLGIKNIPVKETDFIFGIAGEEFGFIGCIIIIILFTLLILRIVNLAMKLKDKEGYFIVIGIATMFSFQVFVNIAMTIGLMPVTGIPLPFISYGGSSLLTCMASLGLVQNIYKQNYKTIF